MPDLTALADGEAPPAPPPLASLRAADQYDGPTSVAEIKELAELLAGAEGMLPDAYVGRPANILAAIMEASRLRIPVMTAIHELYYDGSGQVAMRASLIQLLVRRAGHDLVIHGTPDATRAVVEIVRCDGRTGGVVEWTYAEAVTAGLVANQTWQDYPADCLFARAVARAARRYAADATGGVVYVVEELQSGYADGGEADAALVDRTVTPPVAELLAGLGEAKHGEVRKRWQAAGEQRLLNLYAADGPDGAPWTLGMVLRRALEETMPAPRTAPPISGGPVGAAAGLAPCGHCTVEHVVMYGDHLPDCRDHIGDPLAEFAPPPGALRELGKSEVATELVRSARARNARQQRRGKKPKGKSRKGGRHGRRR